MKIFLLIWNANWRNCWSKDSTNQCVHLHLQSLMPLAVRHEFGLVVLEAKKFNNKTTTKYLQDNANTKNCYNTKKHANTFEIITRSRELHMCIVFLYTIHVSPELE